MRSCAVCRDRELKNRFFLSYCAGIFDNGTTLQKSRTDLYGSKNMRRCDLYDKAGKIKCW